VHETVVDRIHEVEGLDFMMGARAGADRPADVALMLTSKTAVSTSVVQDLRDIVTTHMGEEIVTEVFVLREAELFVAGPEEDEIEEDISE
jgi:hypothetical protein